MAASLVHFAIEQGLPIGVLAWSDGLVAATPNRGKRHRRDLLTILAQLAENMTFSTRQLLDASFELQESHTTAVLVTSRDVQLGLGESVRGGIFVLSTADGYADRWIKFAPNIDFAHSMPMESRGKRQGARGEQLSPVTAASSARPLPLAPSA
jgi:hypothetical protein